jgi:hypothetical protein
MTTNTTSRQPLTFTVRTYRAAGASNLQRARSPYITADERAACILAARAFYTRAAAKVLQTLPVAGVADVEMAGARARSAVAAEAAAWTVAQALPSFAPKAVRAAAGAVRRFYDEQRRHALRGLRYVVARHLAAAGASVTGETVRAVVAQELHR